MTHITSHVLDTARGAPAQGIPVSLQAIHNDTFADVDDAVTDAEGRIKAFTRGGFVAPGTYRLVFQTRAYFEAQALDVFYPDVAITFVVRASQPHYHIPLLLSPYGFTTYRGS